MIPVLAVVLGAGVLFGGNASAASYVAQYVGAAVNGTWVKVNSSGTVGIEVVPTASGTLGVSKGSISVETNANTGYRLYLSGADSESNGYTALYYGGDKGNSAKILSLASAAPSSLSSGYWGYALPSSAVNNFAPAGSYDAVAKSGSTMEASAIENLKFAGIEQNYTFLKSSASANEGNPENIDIYYGAMADYDTLNGSYYNTVIYTAFVEGNDTISVSPSSVREGGTMTISTEIQDLAAPMTADRIGLSLYDSAHPGQSVGTCTDLDIINDGTIGHPLTFSCTYHAGTYTSDNNVQYDLDLKLDPLNNGIYLSYSKPDSWSYQSGLQTISDMQDMTAEICAATPTYEISGNTYTLKDTRGEPKSYLIRKLADNRCWMVQNLALEGGVTLYGADQGSNWDSNIPSGTYITPDGSDYSDKFGNSKAEHMYNGTHKDAQNDNTSDNTGAYYNWNVATAGYDTAGSLSSGNSNKSICPKGWRLPTSTDSGEFQALYAAYGSNKGNMDTAFNLSAYVGGYNIGLFLDSGSRVYWWSSTIYSATNAYYLFENSSGDIYPSDNYYRCIGLSVRCVAQ